MLDAFRMLARYNRIANERLYEACGRLEPVEFRRERKGSFGSISRPAESCAAGGPYLDVAVCRKGTYDTSTELYPVRGFCRASLRARRTGRGNRSVLCADRY